MNKIIKSIISIAMAFVLIFSVGCKQEEGNYCSKATSRKSDNA